MPTPMEESKSKPSQRKPSAARLLPWPTQPQWNKHLLATLVTIATLITLITLVATTPPAQAASVTRSSAFEYDPASGLLTKEIIEPDNPQLCLTTTYTYDTYGNKQSATTTHCAGATGDAVITPRSSSSTFETTGRFVATSSNAFN